MFENIVFIVAFNMTYIEGISAAVSPRVYKSTLNLTIAVVYVGRCIFVQATPLKYRTKIVCVYHKHDKQTVYMLINEIVWLANDFFLV